MKNEIQDLIRKAKDFEVGGAVLVGLLATRDADDGFTWWDIEGIYEVPSDSKPVSSLQ